MAKPNIITTDLEGAFRDQGFPRGLAAKSIGLDIDPGDASWKTGVLRKTLDTIKQAAIRVARRTRDSVTIQEIFDECATTHNDFIEIEDSLQGSCCWEKHRQTSRFVRTLILLSAVLTLWTRLQSSVSEWRKKRTKLTSRWSCHFQNVAKKFSKPDHGGIGQQVNGAGTGDLANTRAPA